MAYGCVPILLATGCPPKNEDLSTSVVSSDIAPGLHQGNEECSAWHIILGVSKHEGTSKPRLPHGVLTSDRGILSVTQINH